MQVLGLTGGVGMGKSTTADLLRARGIPVVDTDDLARQVVEPGQPALADVQKAFGADIVGADGRLRRESLARRVFSTPAARKKLEEILHPRIRELWRAQVEGWRKEGRPLAVVVIPLLFETKAEGDFDAILCVACTEPTQRERLLARGWPPDQVEHRIQAQWPSETKAGRANYVIWTEGPVEAHAEQLARILGRMGGLS